MIMTPNTNFENKEPTTTVTCRRCHRTLTNKKSKELEYGPICIRKVGLLDEDTEIEEEKKEKRPKQKKNVIKLTKYFEASAPTIFKE